MCLEDVRLMRQSKTVDNTVAIATSSVVLAPANRKRIALLISAPTTVRITLSFKDTAVLDQGINLYPTNVPLHLTLEKHGQIVQRKITAIGAALANESIGVWETELQVD